MPTTPVEAENTSWMIARQSWVGRRQAERPIHHFKKSSFFAEHKPLGLREGKIRACFRIGLEPLTITLVGGQIIEGNQAPGDVVCALVRKKISNQVAAASRNDACPGFRILPKCVLLERINLIADEAGNSHGRSPHSRIGWLGAAPTCNAAPLHGNMRSNSRPPSANPARIPPLRPAVSPIAALRC